jgi:hypothetical protein
MSRDLRRRLERPAGVRIAVVIDEADAARVEQDHLAAGDPRSLVMVRTGVPRAEGP